MKSPKAQRGFLHPETLIVLLYVVLGCAWIIGTDLIVEHLSDESPRTILMHSFKGLNFVITTSLLLYLTLKHAFGGWRQAEKKRIKELTRSRALLRDLSHRLQSLREEERTRISRDIHDELGQQLTAIRLKIRLLENFIELTNDRSLNHILDIAVESAELLDEAMDSVRRVATGLRPQSLDHLGLAAAMQEEAREFEQRTGIPCQLQLTGSELSLPREIETAAFRIFQESLTNVVRHASAQSVVAGCSLRADRLVLTIKDNGIGMPRELTENPVTLGLLGMWERAQSVNGTLRFASEPDQGTEITLEIPLNNLA